MLQSSAAGAFPPALKERFKEMVEPGVAEPEARPKVPCANAGLTRQNITNPGEIRIANLLGIEIPVYDIG